MITQEFIIGTLRRVGGGGRGLYYVLIIGIKAPTPLPPTPLGVLVSLGVQPSCIFQPMPHGQVV